MIYSNPLMSGESAGSFQGLNAVAEIAESMSRIIDLTPTCAFLTFVQENNPLIRLLFGLNLS